CVGGVADPAKSVVPVANPADLFRQGSGGCRPGTAGFVVSEGFQRDDRAESCFGIRTLEGVLARPFLPLVCDVLDDGGGIGWTWQGAEGMGPCPRERRGLAFFRFEVGPGFQVLAAKRDGSVKNDPIRSGNRA